MRYHIHATIDLEHERGPEPSPGEVAQAVADRLGDGAYHLHVGRGSTFGGARVIPLSTTATIGEKK